MIKHTHLTPETNEGRFYLHLHFIPWSAPDIRTKLEKLEDGRETP
jgi:hypothetical protein